MQSPRWGPLLLLLSLLVVLLLQQHASWVSRAGYHRSLFSWKMQKGQSSHLLAIRVSLNNSVVRPRSQGCWEGRRRRRRRSVRVDLTHQVPSAGG